MADLNLEFMAAAFAENIPAIERNIETCCCWDDATRELARRDIVATQAIVETLRTPGCSDRAALLTIQRLCRVGGKGLGE